MKMKDYVARYLNPVEMAEEDEMKPSIRIRKKLLKKGDQFRCVAKIGAERIEFNGTAVGYHNNSAIVRDEKGNLHVISYRNMYPLNAIKPIRPTKRTEAVTAGGAPRTAYIFTNEELREWKVDPTKTVLSPRVKETK